MLEEIFAFVSARTWLVNTSLPPMPPSDPTTPINLPPPTHLETALNALEATIVMTDAEARVQWCNAAFSHLIERSTSEIIGQSLVDLLPLTLAGQAIPAEQHPVRLALAGKTGQHQLFEYATPVDCFVLDLTWATFSCPALDLQEGCQQGVVLTIQNLSDSALGAEKQELRVQIQERTAQLEWLNQQLEAEIVRHKRTEEWMRLHQQAVDASSSGIVISDARLPNFPMIYVNSAFEKLTGYSASEMLGHSCRFLQGHDRQQPEIEQIRQALYRGESCNVVLRNYRKDGSQFWNQLTLSPIYDSTHTLTHFIGIQTDITNLVQTETALKESEARLRIAIEAANLGIWDWDIETGVEYWSCESEALFGFAPGAFDHQNDTYFNCVHPDDLTLVKQSHMQARETGVHRVEYRILHPDQQIRWIYTLGKVFYNSLGEAVRMAGVDMDITDRKLAEEQLLTSLREKEVLLEEVHHRVKNNLQMISSLLSLQASSVENPLELAAIRDSQNRVRVMALVHEKLYYAANLSQIRFRDYIEQLTTGLLNSYTSDATSIRLELDVESIDLPIDSLIPCGLIINELVSNAIKYAFPDNRSGTIRVAVRRSPDNWCLLTIGDDGMGISPDLDFRNTSTLGMQLVCAFIQQLRGTIELDRQQGSLFQLTFPIFPIH